jgi:hypothetical protein
MLYQFRDVGHSVEALEYQFWLDVSTMGTQLPLATKSAIASDRTSNQARRVYFAVDFKSALLKSRPATSGMTRPENRLKPRFAKPSAG